MQLLDEPYQEELTQQPETGMGYQLIEASINGDEPELYFAFNSQLLVTVEDWRNNFGNFFTEYGGVDGAREAIQDGDLDQYYDEIDEFEIQEVRVNDRVELF